jgi:hypothetical protein
MDLEEFFQLAVPLYSITEPSGVVCYWWARGVILRGSLREPDEMSFDIVEPDSREMEELVSGAGSDCLLEVYATEVR